MSSFLSIGIELFGKTDQRFMEAVYKVSTLGGKTRFTVMDLEHGINAFYTVFLFYNGPHKFGSFRLTGTTSPSTGSCGNCTNTFLHLEMFPSEIASPWDYNRCVETIMNPAFFCCEYGELCIKCHHHHFQYYCSAKKLISFSDVLG